GCVLVRELGRGRFGEVWLANGPGHIDVALKVLRLGPGQGAEAFRTLKLYRRLNHPNLVPVLGLWLKDDGGRVLADEEADAAGATELVVARGVGEKNLRDRLRE